MGQQEIDVRGTTAGSPAEVWRLLGDSATWPAWTPIDAFERLQAPGPDGTGEVRRFVNGRVTVTERIVEHVPERRLTYVLLAGLPLRDYRAEIDLTPDGAGTAIRWHTTFEAMEAAVSGVLDHLEDYRAELISLMTERFQRHPHAKLMTGQAVAA